MDDKTQEQLMIAGGILIVAGLGYWWYTSRKKSQALAPSLPATPVPVTALPGTTPSPAPGAPGGPGSALRGALGGTPGVTTPTTPTTAARFAAMSIARAPIAMTPTGAGAGIGYSPDTILQAQNYLNQIGSTVPTTGTLDAVTQQAIQSFQAQAGLPPTGQPDPTTMTYLQTAASAKQSGISFF